MGHDTHDISGDIDRWTKLLPLCANGKKNKSHQSNQMDTGKKESNSERTAVFDRSIELSQQGNCSGKSLHKKDVHKVFIIGQKGEETKGSPPHNIGSRVQTRRRNMARVLDQQ